MKRFETGGLEVYSKLSKYVIESMISSTERRRSVLRGWMGNSKDTKQATLLENLLKTIDMVTDAVNKMTEGSVAEPDKTGHPLPYCI